MDRVTPPNYRVPSTPQPTNDRHTETEEGGRVALSLASRRRACVDDRRGVSVPGVWSVRSPDSPRPPSSLHLRRQRPESPLRLGHSPPRQTSVASPWHHNPSPARRETASQNELMKCRVLWCFVFDIYSYSRTAGGHCRTQTAFTLGWFAITLQCDSSPKRSGGAPTGQQSASLTTTIVCTVLSLT